jgi:hypothetical protein
VSCRGLALEAAAEGPQPLDDRFRVVASARLEPALRRWNGIGGRRRFHELLLAGGEV